jgi:hypothetical protein
MQMAYRLLSSHVRVATDIKRVLLTSYAHLLSPEDSNLSTKQIQGGGTGSTHVAHANFTVVGIVKPCRTVEAGTTVLEAEGFLVLP